VSACSTSPHGASTAPNARAIDVADTRSTTLIDGRQPPRRGVALTHEERIARLAIIRDGRRAGRTWQEIAGYLGISLDGLRHWLDKAVTQNSAPRTQRTCLGCGEPFLSEGAHHRMCGCEAHRTVSPFAPDPGGSTGRQVGARRQ
jgi:hypothetical protein